MGGYGRVHRLLTSHGAPSSALQSGNLLVFPSPWSDDHGSVVSTSFPSLNAGRGPATPVKPALALPHPPVERLMTLIRCQRLKLIAES
jgi:hypothetical protein